MYQISANFVNKELRNATLEEKKTLNLKPQFRGLAMIDAVFYSIQTAVAARRREAKVAPAPPAAREELLGPAPPEILQGRIV